MKVEEIEKLASGKGIKKIAVENFLMSLDGLTEYQAVKNLELDKKLYSWNAAIVRAIRKGMGKHFKQSMKHKFNDRGLICPECDKLMGLMEETPVIIWECFNCGKEVKIGGDDNDNNLSRL